MEGFKDPSTFLLRQKVKMLAATSSDRVYFAQHKTRLLLETLNCNEIWLIRLLADAYWICRDTKLSGVFYGLLLHMIINPVAVVSSAVELALLLTELVQC